MHPVTAGVFALFLFGDICAALSPSSSASSPFITIPLVKLHGNSLEAFPNAQVHQMHVRRGARRLAAMASRSSLLDGRDRTPDLRRSLATAPRRRNHHAAIANMVQSRSQPGRFCKEKRIDPANAIQMRDEETSSTDTSREPESESDAEVTKSHDTTFPQSAGLDIEANDIGYLATVYLGTPPQPFRLLVDSGSADMWVGGENCEADEGGDCGDHKFLGERSSSSFRDTGKPWGIAYGTGFVSGTTVTDHVEFAGLKLQNHTFGVASNESAQFTPNDIPLDGILGCAKSSLSKQQTPTLVEALRSANLIASNIYSYKISRKSDGKNDGEIALGAMNPSKFDPSSLVRIQNVNTDGFWEANLDNVTVNGEDVGLVGRSCIWDTGTTLLIAPKPDVDAIHSYIPGAKFDDPTNAWTLPCDTGAVVSLVFGGTEFKILPGDLAFLPVDPKNPTGTCISAIAAGGVYEGPAHWLVGDTVLKNVYLSTNEDTDEISIARLVN